MRRGGSNSAPTEPRLNQLADDLDRGGLRRSASLHPINRTGPPRGPCAMAESWATYFPRLRHRRRLPRLLAPRAGVRRSARRAPSGGSAKLSTDRARTPTITCGRTDPGRMRAASGRRDASGHSEGFSGEAGWRAVRGERLARAWRPSPGRSPGLNRWATTTRAYSDSGSRRDRQARRSPGAGHELLVHRRPPARSGGRVRVPRLIASLARLFATTRSGTAEHVGTSAADRRPAPTGRSLAAG